MMAVAAAIVASVVAVAAAGFIFIIGAIVAIAIVLVTIIAVAIIAVAIVVVAIVVIAIVVAAPVVIAIGALYPDNRPLRISAILLIISPIVMMVMAFRKGW